MRYGYYSATADQKFGHHIYSTPDGRKVKVTETIDANKPPMSKWKDLQFVGEVVSCVKSNEVVAHKLGMVTKARSPEERIAEKLYNMLNLNPESVAKRNPHGLN